MPGLQVQMQARRVSICFEGFAQVTVDGKAWRLDSSLKTGAGCPQQQGHPFDSDPWPVKGDCSNSSDGKGWRHSIERLEIKLLKDFPASQNLSSSQATLYA